MAFEGLDQDVFATYAPDKWSSMVHNLARMKAKETVLAMCAGASEQLGDELAGLAQSSSDEIPNITNGKKVDAQWVFWFRGPDERKSLTSFLASTKLKQESIFNIAAQDKHATLAVILSEPEIWIGLRIAPGADVDRRNLASKLGKPWAREELLELLKELPEGGRAGNEGGVIPTAEVDDATLESYVQGLAEDAPTWEIGHSIAASEAIELGADLADHIIRWLGVFAPFYRFAAWSRENDFIEAGKQIQEEKAQKRRQASSFQKGDKVRITGGLFSGKRGIVEAIDSKAQVKVRVGKMSVVVSGTDLHPG